MVITVRYVYLYDLLILVDILYMKTCSYRGAQPRIVENTSRAEGIFCIEPPEARYGLLPCTREQCRYCLENRHLTGRSEPTVVYHTSQYYKFLNGYQVILNCPAVNIYTYSIEFHLFILDVYNSQYHLCSNMSMSSI